MGFRQMMGAFGVGGPSVETVPAAPYTRPGEQVSGQVHLRGGDQRVDILRVLVGLVTQVETEHEDYEGEGTREFHRVAIAGGFPLDPGASYSIPFQLPVPWETPITVIGGGHLHGMNMGIRTELEVARAIDKTDLDPVAIHPLPSQQRVLEAFDRLGFRFKGADVEQGHLSGVHQQLPFYQEIEFYASHEYSGRVNEVELTFVADPHGLAVILEADKRDGYFHEGGDAFGRFQVTHDQALHMPWEQELTSWLQAAIDRHHGGHGGGHGGGYGGHGGEYGHSPQPGYGYPAEVNHGHHDAYGHDDHGYSDHGYSGHGYSEHGHSEHGGQRRGPGWGGVAAAGAAGLIGGALLGGGAEVIGDGFEVVGDVVGGGFDLVGDVFGGAGDGLEDVGEAVGDFFD